MKASSAVELRRFPVWVKLPILAGLAACLLSCKSSLDDERQQAISQPQQFKSLRVASNSSAKSVPLPDVLVSVEMWEPAELHVELLVQAGILGSSQIPSSGPLDRSPPALN